MKPKLSVEIAGIRMQNPVMNAAGTFDPECYEGLIDADKLGAYVQKSITFNPREGNFQPRSFEVPAGLINRIGLQNVGVVEFTEKKLPLFFKLTIPLIVSVAGESIEDYLKTAIILEEKSQGMIAALEINVSCPNVKDGLIFGSDANLLFNLVSTLKSKITLPLIVKLTPNVTDIGLMAKAAVSAGADVLSLINTVKASAFIERGPNAGQWIEGGLSGICIKHIALDKVRQVSKVVDVPIIAMGGIYETKDALEFLRIKNVWAIAVGTATFRDPSTMIKIVEGLTDYLKEKSYLSIAELKEKERR
jgi:dihydroorotate dehydrogenase (NAD+) catalytic subunit